MWLHGVKNKLILFSHYPPSFLKWSMSGGLFKAFSVNVAFFLCEVAETCLNISKNRFIRFCFLGRVLFFNSFHNCFFPVKHNCLLLLAWGGDLGVTLDSSFSLTTHPEYQQILLAPSPHYPKFQRHLTVPPRTLLFKPLLPSAGTCLNLHSVPLESGRSSNCLHIEIRSCRSFKVANGVASRWDQILETLFPASCLFFPPPQASSMLFLPSYPGPLSNSCRA